MQLNWPMPSTHGRSARMARVGKDCFSFGEIETSRGEELPGRIGRLGMSCAVDDIMAKACAWKPRAHTEFSRPATTLLPSSKISPGKIFNPRMVRASVVVEDTVTSNKQRPQQR